MTKLLWLLLFLNGLCFNSFSQETFSSNREKFVKEFQKLMNQSTAENLNDFVKEQLSPALLESNTFSDRDFAVLVKTSNTILEKRLKAYPELYNYVFSFYSLLENRQAEESFNTWQESVQNFLDARNPKKFKEYVAMSAVFLDKKVLSGDNKTEWCYFGGEYSFAMSGKYPVLELNGGKLICRSFNTSSKTKKEIPFGDSIVITNTSVQFNSILGKIKGEGGTVTWEKVGFPSSQTYAELSKYGVSVSSTTLSADSVLLTTSYFSRKLSGQFTDGIKRGSYNPDRESNYPQFTSDERTLKINNLVDGVDYIGGFSLKGNRFEGLGTNKNPVHLIFKKDNLPFIKTHAQLLLVSEEKLSAKNCEITIPIGEKDSIWHPGLNLEYIINTKSLVLKRGNAGSSEAPFSNTYHQLDMFVEQIRWNTSSTVLDFDYSFSSSEQNRVARFESKAFFDEQLYAVLQGQEAKHPLLSLSQYAYKYDEYLISEGKAATALSRSIEQARPIFFKLSSLGFISYNTETGMIRINEKVEHFVKARSGKIDYDNISFTSDLRENKREFGENLEKNQTKRFGQLDLVNLDLVINAVKVIPISNTQYTSIFPSDNKFTIKENRNFVFNGWVNAGKWEFKVNEADYDYEQNKINIVSSELALFRSAPQKPEHGDKLIPIQSAISNVIGAIYVDGVTNRSGNDVTNYQHYPYLESREKTKVFYDKKSLFRNAYDKRRFFFELDPFIIDSLDNFVEATQYFKGELTSAGIFPKFTDSLKLMADYSLGLVKQAPKGGLDFYGSTAKFDDKIVLSGNGLQGSGEIHFMNSTSVSKIFTFLPDSTVGMAVFENLPSEEGTGLPDVKSEGAYITYLPKSNTLKASSTKYPLTFFNGDADLKGTAVLTKDGLFGSGYVDFSTASLGSDKFTFSRWDIFSDTSIFNLRNTDHDSTEIEEHLAFKTDNVNSSISFKDRKGIFKSNNGESTVTFPVNQYLCKIDKFTWLMDDASVELESKSKSNLSIDSGVDLVGPNFFSIHPKQDSLQFRAGKALFNLKEKTLFCSETEFLDIGDARIYPDSAKLIIRKNAKLEPLENSIIISNYVTKYHKIINATTKIEARRAYSSIGDYAYYDVDSTLYLIPLTEIGLDNSYQTKAKGQINKDDAFRLSDDFDFYGDVELTASIKELTFNGAVKIEHNCDKFRKNWLSFTAAINPDNIQIPVLNEMTDLEGKPVSAGIVWRNSLNTDSVELYPTFLSELSNSDDPKVITATGFLQFDDETNEYQIASKNKLLNRAEKGNFISLHVPSCGLNGDGIIDFGMDYGMLKVENIGVINYTAQTDKTSLNITTKIAAPINENLMEGIAEKISATVGLRDGDFASNTLEEAIINWVDEESSNQIKSDYVLNTAVKKIPKEMKETFVFTGVRLNSHVVQGNPQRGLKTNVDNALLVNIYGKPIMKYVPFKMFVEQKVGGDELSFLIDLPGNDFYFFQYTQGKKDGVMNVLTSDNELNTQLSEMKEDKLKEKHFTLRLSQESIIKNKFLRIFN